MTSKEADGILTVNELGGGIFKAVSDERYFSKLSIGSYMEVGRINIDINDRSSIESIVNSFNLDLETKDRLIELSEKNVSGKQKVSNVCVYTANALLNRTGLESMLKLTKTILIAHGLNTLIMFCITM